MAHEELLWIIFGTPASAVSPACKGELYVRPFFLGEPKVRPYGKNIHLLAICFDFLDR